jgi:F-type H+-transporting ATPase subunit b
MRAWSLPIALLMLLGSLLAGVAASAAPEAEVVDHDDPRYEQRAEHAEEYGHDEPSLFASAPWPYVWNLLMFLVLFGVLAKFVWPAILSGLQAREQKITGDLARAEHARADAEQTLAGYKQQLADARAESQQIIEQSRGEAEKVAAGIKADAEREINAMRQRAQQDIAAAKEQALSDLYAQAATLATDVAGKILHRELRPEDQQALIEQSVNELRSSQNN